MRRALAAAVLAAGLTLSAASNAAADVESFMTCPSGASAVSSVETSCPFADNVRYAYYRQPGRTVFTYSPVTGKFYTMQCGPAVTSEDWLFPKRCFGINEVGAPLVVYIA